MTVLHNECISRVFLNSLINQITFKVLSSLTWRDLNSFSTDFIYRAVNRNHLICNAWNRKHLHCYQVSIYPCRVALLLLLFSCPVPCPTLCNRVACSSQSVRRTYPWNLISFPHHFQTLEDSTYISLLRHPVHNLFGPFLNHGQCFIIKQPPHLANGRAVLRE